MTGRAGGVGAPAGTAMSDERRAIGIDPRIRQRRIDVRREEGRRRLRFLVGTAAVLFAAGAGAAATRSPLLDVDHVHVTGAVQTNDADAVRAGQVERGRLMVDIDAGAAAARIERLRWVASARVTRDWPSTVRIEVVERTAVAAIAVGDGAWAPVDRHGRVLDVSPERPPLPALMGIAPLAADAPVAPPASRAALSIIAAMPADLARHVAGVSTTPGGLEVALHGGGVVRLGPPTEVPAKLAAVAVLLERVDPAAVATVDVRVPDAPVLTRR